MVIKRRCGSRQAPKIVNRREPCQRKPDSALTPQHLEIELAQFLEKRSHFGTKVQDGLIVCIKIRDRFTQSFSCSIKVSLTFRDFSMDEFHVYAPKAIADRRVAVRRNVSRLDDF